MEESGWSCGFNLEYVFSYPTAGIRVAHGIKMDAGDSGGFQFAALGDGPFYTGFFDGLVGLTRFYRIFKVVWYIDMKNAGENT